MARYTIRLTLEAQKHLRKIEELGDRAMMRKVKSLLIELSEHPMTGTGRPERLRYAQAGLWSRRINHKDRLIYQIKDDVVEVLVLSMLSHYGDK